MENILDIESVKDQVLKNCDIADSQHAGLYSICGLALRLRDLFKWEKGLDPWVERESVEVLEWIEAKEHIWDALANADFNEIELMGRKCDPFDAEQINALLEPHGFIYGSGFAGSLKPTFFLAAIENKKTLDGHPVYILGRELARDLLTLPALSQNDRIFIRRKAARTFLWDQMLYIQKSGRPALKFALAHSGVEDRTPRGLHKHLDRIVDAETDRYIYHELGELQDTAFDRNIWRQIVAAFPQTAVELFARTVKDLSADTNAHGTLQHICHTRRMASLGFYVAFLEGLAKKLFPEIIDAFEEFVQTSDWGVIDRAAADGYETARRNAEAMMAIFQKGRQQHDDPWIEAEMNRVLLQPLGLT